ncbi:MAG TPA: hypothetical protein VF529_12705 [Solirubrobacteraceae bacterium]
MGAAGGAVTAAGDRSVAVGGDVRDSIIVTGDHATVRVVVGAEDGARLERMGLFARRSRRRRDPPLGAPPPPPDGHVDREDELRAIRRPQRAINVHGPRGIGKTWVVREALSVRAGACVYVDAKGRAADDLVQELFEAFWETEPPVVPVGVALRDALAGVRALIVLDGFDGPEDDAARVLAAAPGCSYVVTSRDRVLWEGDGVVLEGFDADACAELAAQALGRTLSADEQAAAARLCDAVEGHPLRIRQAVARGFPPAPGAPPSGVGAPASAADEAERRVVAALALFGEAAVGVERLAEITGVRDVAAVLERLRERSVATAHSPRWTLLAPAQADPGLVGPALASYTAWAAAASPAGVALEAPAILALLSRAVEGGRDAEAIALARAVDRPLAASRRWGAWGEVLERALGAAERLGDADAEAWARHQLGTRAFCLGTAGAAATLLERALELRDAAVTRHNLRIVRGGGGSGPRWRQAGVLGVVAAVGIGTAVAIGRGGGGDESDPVPVARTTQTTPPRTTNTTNTTTTDPPGTSTEPTTQTTRPRTTNTTTIDPPGTSTQPIGETLTLDCPRRVKGTVPEGPVDDVDTAAPRANRGGTGTSPTVEVGPGATVVGRAALRGHLEPPRVADIAVQATTGSGEPAEVPEVRTDPAGDWETTVELTTFGVWGFTARVAERRGAEAPPCTTNVVD